MTPETRARLTAARAQRLREDTGRSCPCGGARAPERIVRRKPKPAPPRTAHTEPIRSATLTRARTPVAMHGQVAPPEKSTAVPPTDATPENKRAESTALAGSAQPASSGPQAAKRGVVAVTVGQAPLRDAASDRAEPLKRREQRIARRLCHMRAALSQQDGMSTAEYAVGTIAAVAFAGVLLKVLTSDTVSQAVSDLITRALS